jgi:RsiW-degrading membrane proteinase PrsW (M82 family)
MSELAATSGLQPTSHVSNGEATMRVFQPRNLASWVFLFYLVLGLIANIRYFRPGFEALSTAAFGAFALFAIYMLPWIWMLRHIDRWTQIPAKLAVYAFLWGALPATFLLALPSNTALLSIYNKAVSPTFAQDWGPAFTAPFDEETAKGIGILLLMFIAPRLIRSPFDGFIVGAFVGLGFQILEDASYAINGSLQTFGSEQVGPVIQMVGLRGSAGICSHALFSAVFGTGLVYLIGTSTTKAHRMRGIGLIVLAMLFHGVWDSMSAIAGRAGVNALVVIVITVIVELTALYLIYRFASKNERSSMRELLAGEVARGTISETELAALSGSRKARKHFARHASGYTSKKTPRYVLEAGGDLAKALAASGGVETAQTAHARAELARVRGL